ncbi:MAG: hypothetical protein FJW30_17405 [Acidobacteria bacterium]|nr:hypothetical protein [Acidobacteriota bacterium]
MTPSQWTRAKSIFDELCELEPESQSIELSRRCQDDPVVREQVRRLLELDGEESRFLSPPSQPRFLRGEPTALLESGELIAKRYRIRALVGAGGMGEVYEAVDTESGERIALKTVRAGALLGERAKRQIEKEARMAGTISHRNVCRVYDVGEHDLPSGDTVAVLAMEFLEGVTLSQWIRENAPSTAEKALPLVRQMCAALDAAYERGVVHRDFKPSNMILTEGRLVVTDFGLAVEESPEPTSAITTGSSSRFLGTLEYMAPEQLRSGESSARSDVYSLGVVLYEMVTGERPTKGSNSLEEILNRFLTAPPSPRAINRALPAAWEFAILRCLHTDPLRRPGSAGEALRLIEGNSAAAAVRLAAERPMARRAMFAAGVAAAGGAAWKAYRWRWPANVRATTVVLAGVADPPELAAIHTQVRLLLGQSRAITVWDSNRKAEVLRLMGRPAGSPLSDRDWREVAARENFSMVAFLRLDGGALQVRLEQVGARPETPAATWTQTVPAGNADQYIAAAAQAADWIRDSMGETTAEIAENRLPPEAVTTPSWDALREFQRAEEYRARELRPEAIVALDAAIRYDPQFTMAFARRGDVLISIIRNEEAYQSYMEAERLLKVRPMSRREELRFLAMFAQDSRDYKKAEKLFLEYAQLFPNDHYGFFHRASALQFLGLFQEALGELAKLEPMPESTKRRLVHSCYAAAGAGEFDRAHNFASQLQVLGHNDYGYSGLECLAYLRGRSKPTFPF